MAKNKGTIGKKKDAAPAAPDEFVSAGGRVVERVRPHAKKLAALGVLAALGLVAFAVWRWQHGRQLAAATDLYHRALLLGQVPLADDPLLAIRGEPEPDDIQDLPASFADAAARATAQLATLDQLEREHGGSGPADQARVLRGAALLTLGRGAEAADAFRAFAADTSDPALRESALEGVGYGLEAKAVAEKEPAARQAGLEAALGAFEALQPADDGPGRARALYQQGRILAVLGRADDAKQRLDAALAKDPDPSLRAEIDTRLDALGEGTASPPQGAGHPGAGPASTPQGAGHPGASTAPGSTAPGPK